MYIRYQVEVSQATVHAALFCDVPYPVEGNNRRFQDYANKRINKG